MKMSEEREAYIAQCEAKVAAHKEQIRVSRQRQQDFETRFAKMINDVVAIVNEPLLALIRDIRESK